MIIRTKRQCCRGLTVLETAVALFVIMVGVLGMFQAIQTAFNHGRYLDERNAAMTAVINELETLRAVPFSSLENGRQEFRSHTPRALALPEGTGMVQVSDFAEGLKEVCVRYEWLGPNGRRTNQEITSLIGRREP